MRRSQNLDFLGLKDIPPGQFLGAPTHADIIEFQNLKIRRMGAKMYVAFLLFWFWKELSSFKVILLNKKINFVSKLENPTHSFRETYIVLQLLQKSKIKSKTVMSWSSQKKIEGIFLLLAFFKVCVLSQCIVYWIHFQNIHTFTYQEHYFIHFCCLFLKLSKAFSISLTLT